MKPDENRRRFIGSMAFGMPILSVASAAAFAQSFNVDHQHHAAAPGDALLDHVQDHIAAIIRAVTERDTPIMADEARSAAAYLNVLAVHGRTTGLDEGARRALQAQISRKGRHNLLAERVDIEHVQHAMERRGIRLPQRFVEGARGSQPAQRDVALEMVLAGRTSLAFSHMATMVETAAPRLADKAQGSRQVQFGGGMCDYLFSQSMLYMALASGFCTVSSDDPGMVEWCQAIWAGAALADFVYWATC